MEVPPNHKRFSLVKTAEQCNGDHRCLLKAFEQERRERWVRMATVELIGEKLHACYAKHGPQNVADRCKNLAVEYMKHVSDLTHLTPEVFFALIS